MAIATTYPLARRFSTHFPGAQTPEFSINTWNMWHFRYALSAPGSNPLWTDHQYWPYGANLVLTHYTLFNDVAGAFLGRFLGFEATYNLLFLLSIALSGYGVYLISRDHDVEHLIAFVSGALFACSPVLMAHVFGLRGAEYTNFFAVPFFVWALSRTIRERRTVDAVLAALFLTITWCTNYYYFLSCLLLIPLFFFSLRKPLTVRMVRRAENGPSRLLRRTLEATLVLLAGWVISSVLAGQIAFHGTGSFRSLIAYVAPYLAFWAAAALYLALLFRPSLRWNADAFRLGSIAPYAVVLTFWGTLNLPMILSTLYFMNSGDYGAPPDRWRGGGNPVDLASLFLPQYSKTIWGERLASALHCVFPAPASPALGLIPLLCVLWLWRRRPDDERVDCWYGGLFFFLILMLGPWLKILGVNTYLPLPFYFLHLLPVFSNMPNGIYFNLMASLFLSLLFGISLRTIKSGASRRLAAWIPAIAFCAVAIESAHVAIPTFKMDFPPLIHRLRDRPDGAVLMLPASGYFHMIRYTDHVGTSFMDNLSAQIVHHKPYVGGNMGRVARRVFDHMSADPFFQDILSAQSGSTPSFRLKDRRLIGRYLKDTRIRYVLVETRETPPALKRALQDWPLRLEDREGNLELYAVNLR
ncbi:MAG: hypothetical protein A2V88_18195 [Elusimicrobia bacterium RBG_16_66_12]|nr:MAG: hypothetical protein A2V88_18195 [Elusimicrobia bacterium RBG_16_66_12]